MGRPCGAQWIRILWATSALVTTAGSLQALDATRPLTQCTLDLWRTTDGLPQNSVQAIHQTRDGYLWVATQEGLARFDGLTFTVFDTSNSPIPGNFIEYLHEDREGALWFGSFHRGVTRLYRGRFRTYTTQDGLSANDASAIAEDLDGTLWFGTLESGLNRFREGRFTVYRVAQGLPDDRIRALLRARDGTLWIGTEAGLARLRDGRFTTFGKKEGLLDENIGALEEDEAGALWVGTSRGLSRFEKGRFTAYGGRNALSTANVYILHRDPGGSLWIGTDVGLSRLRDGRLESFGTREGLSQGKVVALAGDREGSLWIGTDGGGLNRLKDARVVPFRAQDPEWHEDTNVIVGDGRGGLWVGADGGQISHFRSGVTSVLPTALALRNSDVRALESHGDDLWIGTDLGLYLYRRGHLQPFPGQDVLPRSAVRAIHVDRRGTLWVGTDGQGLGRQEKAGFVVYQEKDGLAGNRVRFIHEDRQGRIWIGTYGGLSLFEDGLFRNYGPAEGLSDTLVRSVYEDAAGVFWIGTYGGGLFRFRDGRFSAFTRRQGLLSDIIYGIAEDAAGALWMSCNKGIFRVSKKELEDLAAEKIGSVHVATFSVGEGMKGNECNGGNPAVWQAEDGSLWFPTLKGIVRVDPAHLPTNLLPPPVAIEAFVSDGQPLDVFGDVRLPPGRHHIEIRYAGLSFLSPDRVEVSYRLEGIDSDWIAAGSRRVAYYTNLPPGAYRFQVKATNEDGVANESGASLSFVQQPRFYETRAFALAWVGSLGLAAFGAHRLRIARLRRRERELEQRVGEALANVKVLSGLLPVCASCKKIRDDKGYWNQIETYISERSEAEFSHGICPDCLRRLYPEQAERVLGKKPIAGG